MRLILFAPLILILTGCYQFDRFRFRPFPVPGGSGVTFYDSSRSYDGFNVVNQDSLHACRILDMEGHDVETLPGAHCRFLPNGEFFSNTKGPTLFNSSFEIVWRRPELWHRHEATYDEKRDWIWILTYERSRISGKEVIHDRVLALDRKTGETRYIWQPELHLTELYAHYKRKPEYYFADTIQAYSITHLNSIEVLPPNTLIGGGGDLLISDTGPTGTVYALNVESGRISWSMHVGTEALPAIGHHSPHYLDGGRIALFINNSGDEAAQKFGFPFSFLAIYDGVAGKSVWNYRAPPEDSFYSPHFGNLEPLPNGNFLITHIAGGGSAFEVTLGGRVVWEWNNDLKDESGHRAEVYRVDRVSKPLVLPYIQNWRKAMASK